MSVIEIVNHMFIFFGFHYIYIWHSLNFYIFCSIRDISLKFTDRTCFGFVNIIVLVAVYNCFVLENIKAVLHSSFDAVYKKKI